MFLKCYVDTSLNKFLLGFFLALVSVGAEAKVFNLSKQTIGTYIRGTYGQSAVGKNAYGSSSGSGTTFNDSFDFNTGGEFGIYTGVEQIGLRLSAEFLNPKAQKNINGVNSGGSTLMNLDSNIAAVIYKGSIEYSWFIDEASKWYLSLGVGSATVTLTNEYTNIDASFGISDFTEKGTETLIMGEVLVGYEYNFSADTTVMLDLGWRQLHADGLQHTSNTTTFGGNVVAGDTMTNSDGSNRTLDLGGFFIGLGLRFYINQ
jgi:hypothetical protein